MPATDDRLMRVRLSPEVHEELEAHARRLGVSATDLARRAIEARVRQLGRKQVADEITAYAEAMAGTEFDFDPAISAAGMEVWAMDDEGWSEDDAASDEASIGPTAR